MEGEADMMPPYAKGTVKKILFVLRWLTSQVFIEKLVR